MSNTKTAILATIGKLDAERWVKGKFLGRKPLANAWKERELLKKYGAELDRISHLVRDDVKLLTPKVVELLVKFYKPQLLMTGSDMLLTIVTQMTRFKLSDGKQCPAFTAIVDFVVAHCSR